MDANGLHAEGSLRQRSAIESEEEVRQLRIDFNFTSRCPTWHCADNHSLFMTNLLVTISLALSTNWHALQGLPLEVQLVKKEHTAMIVYLGATNSFVLKTEWEALATRGQKTTSFFSTTNIWQPWDLTTDRIILLN